MINKATYNTPELIIIAVTDDLIRTSVQAPDVYTKDPFIEG